MYVWAAFGRRLYEHDGLVWLLLLYEGFSSDGKVEKMTGSLTRRLSSDCCSAEVFWKRVGLKQLFRPMITPEEASNTSGIIQLSVGMIQIDGKYRRPVMDSRMKKLGIATE